MDVAKTDIVQCVKLLINTRLVLEEGERILDGEIENVGDRQSTESHLQCLSIVSLALADVARNVHVRKEVHLDLYETISLARFAAPAFHVEREPARPVSANLRLRHLGEELTNRRKQPCVGRGIRSRSSANRALIDVDNLVDLLESGDSIVCARHDTRAIEMAGERIVEDVLDECRLSRARYSSDCDKKSERNIDIHVEEIVLSRAFDPDQSRMISWATCPANFNPCFTAKILPGYRRLVIYHIIDGSFRDDHTAMLSRARTKVDEMIGF